MEEILQKAQSLKSFANDMIVIKSNPYTKELDIDAILQDLSAFADELIELASPSQTDKEDSNK